MMMMMMMMMMIIMTLMKLVNSATKFRHGMDKFYQPNSGLGSSRSLHEAIYTHRWISHIVQLYYTYIYIYIYYSIYIYYNYRNYIIHFQTSPAKYTPAVSYRVVIAEAPWLIAKRTPDAMAPWPSPWMQWTKRPGSSWHNLNWSPQ